MSPLAADIIGLIGSAIFLAAFAYANLAKHLNKVWFNLANLVGAILLLISLSVTFNLAAFVLEAAWGTIAAVGLVLAIRRSVRATPATATPQVSDGPAVELTITPFIANNEEKRTVDSERGLELVTAGGGSSGGTRFILKGRDFQLHFSGTTDSLPIEGVDQNLHASISKVLIWKVYSLLGPIPGRSMEETRQIIMEALTAFKGVHGYPAGQRVAVRFPSGLED